MCLDAHHKAIENGTAIVTGTQYRRQTNYVEAVKRIHDGEIGDIINMTARYCSTGIWYRPRRDGMSDTQYQVFNWMHFIWLSGDQIAEQAVHNIDFMNWVMDGPPESAYGSGGRFTRPEDSEMWDNMAVDYTYPGNRQVSFMCRQIPDTKSNNSNVVYGTKGIATIYGGNRGAEITDRQGKEIWSMKGNIGAAYQQEHKDLVDSIRAGKPIVELIETANSSMTAVLGRSGGLHGTGSHLGLSSFEIRSWDCSRKTSTSKAHVPNRNSPFRASPSWSDESQRGSRFGGGRPSAAGSPRPSEQSEPRGFSISRSWSRRRFCFSSRRHDRFRRVRARWPVPCVSNSSASIRSRSSLQESQIGFELVSATTLFGGQCDIIIAHRDRHSP